MVLCLLAGLTSRNSDLGRTIEGYGEAEAGTSLLQYQQTEGVRYVHCVDLLVCLRLVPRDDLDHLDASVGGLALHNAREVHHRDYGNLTDPAHPYGDPLHVCPLHACLHRHDAAA